MARGTTLSNLRSMLKAELGEFSGTNATRDAELDVRLSDKQKQLANEVQWSFLERRWNAAVPANQQFTTFPIVDADFGESAIIDLDQISNVEVRWNQVYQPVVYGIGEDEYNTMDYSLGQQSDPIQRWREASNIDETSSPNKFEVWPVPVTAQTIRFTGQRQLLPLAASSDTADLDDMLLVLGVAADLLTKSKQADATLCLQKFGRLMTQLRQRSYVRDKVRVLGGGGESDFKRERKLVGMTIAVK